MTLEAYTKAAEAAGGKGYAKLKDNVVLPPEAAATILKGGAWKRDTDEWDVHIADAASPAVDRGLKVEYVRRLRRRFADRRRGAGYRSGRIRSAEGGAGRPPTVIAGNVAGCAVRPRASGVPR